MRQYVGGLYPPRNSSDAFVSLSPSNVRALKIAHGSCARKSKGANMKQHLKSTAVATHNRATRAAHPQISFSRRFAARIRRSRPRRRSCFAPWSAGKRQTDLQRTWHSFRLVRLLRDMHEKAGVTDRLSLLVWALQRMEIGERRTCPRDGDGYLRPA